MADDKTEAPTDKKLEDARRDGEMPKSTDLAIGALLMACAFTFSVAGPGMGEHLRVLMKIGLDVGRASSADFDARAAMIEIVTQVGFLLLPVFAVAMLVPALALILQIGINISFKPVELKLTAISPAAGIKKIFSVRSLIDLAKMVVKAGVLILVLYKVTLGLLPLVAGVVYETVPDVIKISWLVVWHFLAIAGLAYFILGSVDFGIQRWLFMRDHRMSKDEIKREGKESEGDPEIKNKRKEIARSDANAAPKPSITGATAIVVNPTHYAVALRYDPLEYGLPRVIAKAVDAQALEIRRAAEQIGIPIFTSPALARSLYLVPLNEAIPDALFESVAEVLTWVSRLGAPN